MIFVIKSATMSSVKQKDEVNVTTSNHSTNQMISNCNVSNLAHFSGVGGNAAAGLGVGIERVGFGTQKTEEAKHILDMDQLFGTHTSGDKFRRASTEYS
jgi:hypothetical protein